MNPETLSAPAQRAIDEMWTAITDKTATRGVGWHALGAPSWAAAAPAAPAAPRKTRKLAVAVDAKKKKRIILVFRWTASK